MDYFELLKKRRSIRDFQDKEITVDLVKEIIAEACMAPSSSNRQPWRFIVVNNKERIRKLSDESKRNLLALIEENPDSPTKQYETTLRDKAFNVFYNAPCLVLIVGPNDIRSLFVDCSLAACYLMLSAAARGLGTCWIGLGSAIRDPKIREEIGLPHDFRIIAPIAIGYPRNIPEVPLRHPPQILKVITEP